MSKVAYGAKRPRFAPIATEPAGALPTYTADSAVTVGELVSANLTVNMVSGELDSDDALNVKVEEFRSGTLAMVTDGMEDETAEAIYGATVEEGLVTYNIGDVAPNGGLTFYRRMKDKSGVVYFQGVFYPKVQAALGNVNSATKGSSITFSTANTNFTIMAAANGAWMLTETLATEAEAESWCDEQLGITGVGG